MQDYKRENSIIKQNILKYLEFKGISKYECYNKTGISRSVLSQPNGMTEDNLLKFLAHYKDVDLNWLLTGEGEMLLSADNRSNIKSDTDPTDWEKMHHKLSMEMNECKSKLIEMQTKLHEAQISLLEMQHKYEGNADISVIREDVKTGS